MKKKVKNKLTRIIAVGAAILSLFCSTSIPIRAADSTVTAGAYTGYSVNVSNPDGHSEWNANYQTILIEGEIGFCIQPGYILKEGPGFIPKAYEAKQVSVIAYEGWVRSNHTMEDYLSTQFLIWEEMGGTVTTTSFSAYGTYKANILNKIAHHNDKPSFNNMNVTVKVGESVTITDTNGVFEEFNLASSNGLTVSKSGNSLTITGTLDAPENAQITYNKVPDNCVGTSVAYTKPGSQEVAKLYVSDPLPTLIKVKVLKYGSLKIAKKTNEGKMVPNTTFKLSYNADMSAPIGTYTTGADGTVKIDELLSQTVYIQEISVPANLVLNPTIHSMTIVPNDVVTYTQMNNIQKGKITLKKVDAETGNKPQGEATLAGATYGLFARENIVDPITGTVLIAKNSKVAERITKADGSMDSIENLYLGEYYVQETVASTGYILNPEKINVSLKYAGSSQSVVVRDITSKESIINGDFQITKVIKKNPHGSEINKPEPNAEFQAVLKKYVTKYGSVEAAWQHRSEFNNREYDELKTDKDGIAVSKKLAYGTYVVKQTKIGNEDVDLLSETFVVVIKDQNQPTIKYVISNQLFLSYLQIVKKDADTGKNIGLSETTFKVFDVGNDEYVSQRVGMIRQDTWKTDIDGKVTLPLQLPAGNYRLEEITAPDGYLINTKPIEFKMKESHVSFVDDENEPIVIVEMKDEKPTGSVELVKTDEESKELLSGVQYQLTAAEDILDPADGSIIYKAGDPVSMDISEDGYYMTDENGEIHVAGLPLGSYTWKETKALDGYVKDEKEHSFMLTQKNDTQKVYTHKEELENQKTRTELLKVDVDGKALAGAKLHLSDSEGNVIKEWISKDSSIILKGLHVGKKYTLYEDVAPVGYVLSKPVEFIIQNDEKVQSIKMLDKQVMAIKKDEDGNNLSGAKLQVISNQTKDIVDEWTSEDKEHNISNLIEGKDYILREVEAPEGLRKAEDVHFRVSDKIENQKIEIIDDYILKDIQIIKVDRDTGKPIKTGDFTFTVYRDKECKQMLLESQGDTETGIAKISLRYGEWWIKETKAPKGYELSNEVKHVKIGKDGVFLDGTKLGSIEDTISFPFENVMKPLIKTGDNDERGLYLLLMCGSAVIICLIIRKRKKNAETNIQ